MQKIIAAVAVALTFAFIGQVSADDAASYREWEKAQVSNMVPIHGAYRNEQYGFGIKVVSGKVYRPAAPNPNHGVLVILGNQRTISVSAEFDAAEYGSTKSQLDHWLENEHADSVKREATTLAGKPAEQAILQAGQVVTKVIAQRRDEDGGILYELTLTSTQTHRRADSALFDSIARSFKTYALQ
jgi:hypothetical protein